MAFLDLTYARVTSVLLFGVLYLAT